MPSAERVVLCFGDSNTYGFDAATGARFARDVRWPGVLAARLGDGWRVIEEGLGGRTTIFDDPVLPGRNGSTYLPPCLGSHAPLDVVAITLGTNDLKARFGASAAQIAGGVGVLVRLALESGAGPDGAAPAVLVLGLPRLGRVATPAELHGAPEKAAELPALLAATATEFGVDFLDLSDVSFGDLDGYHLGADGHRAIGEKVAARLGDA